MSEYVRDYGSIDDALLTPRQAVQIWRTISEEARHRFMNTLYQASEQLHDQVLVLTATFRDAGKSSDTKNIRSDR